ncbi:MAG: hypothetical protein JXR34_04740 [Bacteroidales bacterium]|nr:hypothetical protein [Bacteroidales bacterium]
MKNNRVFLILWLVFFILLTFAYRNHFDNSFHFDDGHTIQNNLYIRSLHNIPDFFTEGAYTFSTLPANQVYRPMVSTSLAIDFWISSTFDKDHSGFNTFYYHLSMFVQYLLMLVLLYLLIVKLLSKFGDGNYLRWFAFGGTVYFGFHLTNGETLNYIISRSDLISTFFVIAALDVFLYFPRLRKTGLYIIPFVIGLLTKQTAAVFLPILVVYYFLFELDGDLKSASSNVSRRKKIVELLTHLLILTIVTGALVYLVLHMQSDSYNPGGSSLFLYMVTQTFVVFHYFISFFFPYHLSADTDWGLFASIWDVRFFIGLAFLLSMGFLVYKTIRQKELRPIAFGILWFFIALAPTSSIIPLAEVMNDHRIMYPFVGLTISLTYSLYLLYVKYQTQILSSFLYKNGIVGLLGIVFFFHFFGIMQRAEVWNNGKTLWYDVTVKSPKNGRGLMNYGLQLAGENKPLEALDYYKRALELMPYYSYLHTNIAIVYNSLDSIEKAEWHHKKSVELQPLSHNGYYYYGIFLREKKRFDEMESNFKKTVELAPDFIFARYGLLEYYFNNNRWKELMVLLDETAYKWPDDATVVYYQGLVSNRKSQLKELKVNALKGNDAKALIDLSLHYYNQGQFDSVIYACALILKTQPDHLGAHNNIVAALNSLGRYSDAYRMGQEAISKGIQDQLLVNNIALAQTRMALLNQIDELNSTTDLINLSLSFYNQKMYKECILACEKVIVLDPNNSLAYNNICSAYNALEDWENAVKAGEKALEINPDYELAKNNLAWARKNLKD